MKFFFLSLGYCFILIFINVKIAEKFDFLDYPSDRKTHKNNIPYLGGISILLYILTIIFFIEIDEKLVLIIYSSIPLVIIGLIDDKLNISIYFRLIVQLFCFGFLFLNNIKILYLGGLLNIELIGLGSFVFVFSLGCVLLLTNSFNYLDGIDSLAASIFLSSSLMLYLFVLLKNGVFFNNLLIFQIPVIVFIFFNLTNYLNLKIFLGDNGSLLLGYLLGLTGIYLVYNLTYLRPEIFVWFVAFPVYEFLSTNLFRLIKRKSLFKPGKDHIHYILLKRFTKLKTLSYLISLNIFLSLLGFITDYLDILNYSLIFFVILFFIYFLVRGYLFDKPSY